MERFKSLLSGVPLQLLGTLVRFFLGSLIETIPSEPLPFECDMNVRSEKARELIKGEPIVI